MKLDQTNNVRTFAHQQRQTLFNQLPDNSAVLVSSGHEKIRNRDVEYPFRADSDFSFLTGFYEPDSVLLLVKKQQNQSVIFVRPKDTEQETWQGRRMGVEMAPQILALEQAFSIDALDQTVAEYLENIEHLYFSFSQMSLWSAKIENWVQGLKSKVRQGISAPTQLCDLDALLHENRVIKSPQEIKWLRHAAQISVAGHLAAMRAVQPGLYEFQVQAELENTFKH